jgi:sugar phosphate isomerase/epimerase
MWYKPLNVWTSHWANLVIFSPLIVPLKLGGRVKLALFAASMLDRSWEETLDAAKRNGIDLIEPSAGGHIPKVHYDPVHLASDSQALEKFRQSLADRGQSICSFSCHGNPLHPNPAIARAAHDDFVATCQIAHHLGVGAISLLAGTPGGAPDDTSPNWIFHAAFPMFKKAYKWQWEERVIPYWTEAAKIADKYQVKIAVEPHPGDVVYNTQTFLRLRKEVGPTIALNLDPSHLWWQGIDPVVFVETVGDAICTCHVKDVAMDARLIARDGVVSSADYDDWEARSWSYCTLGYGHSELFWREFLIALRRTGYDGHLSIECEEPYLTVDESLAKAAQLLRTVMPQEPKPLVNWMEAYGLDDYEANLQSPATSRLGSDSGSKSHTVAPGNRS